MNLTETTFKVKEMPAIVTGNTWSDKFPESATNTGHKFIVREDNGMVLSCMTDDYKVVQNNDLIDIVNPIIKDQGGVLSDAKVFGGGGRSKWTWKFNDNKIKVENEDSIAPTIDIWNSYDGTVAVNILAGAFRFVCSNGMVIGYILGKANFRHINNNMSLKPEEIAKSVSNTVMKTKNIFTDEFPKLIETPVKKTHITELIKMLPNQTGDDIVRYLLEKTIENYWDLLNAATWIATHKMNRKYEATHKFESRIWPNVKKWVDSV